MGLTDSVQTGDMPVSGSMSVSVCLCVCVRVWCVCVYVCACVCMCVQVAWAHVRGGGDVGRSWAAAGRGTHKHNSVSDYRTALHALVDAGVAAPGGVAAYATSAGTPCTSTCCRNHLQHMSRVLFAWYTTYLQRAPSAYITNPSTCVCVYVHCRRCPCQRCTRRSIHPHPARMRRYACRLLRRYLMHGARGPASDRARARRMG